MLGVLFGAHEEITNARKTQAQGREEAAEEVLTMPKPKQRNPSKKPDRPKLGSGLAEKAAQSLESRGSKIDRMVAAAAKGDSKGKGK